MEEESDTREIVERVRSGDTTALEALFARHRDRLRRAVSMSLDRRLAARLDASDVVQDVYVEAVRRLREYLGKRDFPFYLWLRLLARDRVIDLRRRHFRAGKRDAGREANVLPDDSSRELVTDLTGGVPSPESAFDRAELTERLETAIAMLDEDEREVVLWRHFEGLSNREAAALLGIAEAAASKRHVRALEKLRGILAGLGVRATGKEERRDGEVP